MAKSQSGKGIAVKLAACFAATFQSIHGYFLLSGILYLLAGGLVYASYFLIHQQMCNAVAKYPCGDNVLMAYPNKRDCWRIATNITYLDKASDANKPLFKIFTGATQDSDCLDVIRRAGSPLHVIAEVATMRLSTPTAPTDDCVAWNCQVLVAAAFAGRYTVLQSEFSSNGTASYSFAPCTNTVSTIEKGTVTFKPADQADVCICQNSLASEWDDLYADSASFWRDSSGNYATYQSLMQTCIDVFKDDPPYVQYLEWAKTGGSTPAPAAATGAVTRRLEENSTAGRDCDGPTESTEEKPYAETALAETSSGEAAARRLDEDAAVATPAATASSLNDDLPEYTVTPWSRCTCIQACLTGLKTRSVTCPAGQTCKEPKPPANEKCVCSHCADCVFMVPWLVMGGAFGLQAILSLILFLAFNSIADITTDDLISFGCCRWITGCFCKFLPIIVRFFVYVSLVCLLWLTTIALIPISGWMTDCKANQLLRLVLLIMISIWAVQLLVGLGMRANQRVPPWLYFSQSKNMKFLCAPCRRIGP